MASAVSPMYAPLSQSREAFWQAADPPVVRVVQVSDPHVLRTRPALDADAKALATELASLHPTLVVVTGDVVEHDPDSRQQADVARRWLGGLESELRAPVLILPGNHDVGENGRHDALPAEWLGPPVTSGRVSAFIERWGSDRFAVTLAETTFVGINSQLLGSGLEEERAQQEWLHARLVSLPGPWVLCSHQPLLLPDGSSPESHWALPPAGARQLLLGVCDSRPPLAVLSGHIHAYSSQTVGPTTHVTCPSLSRVIDQARLAPLAGSRAVTGFLVHDFSPCGATHRLVEREPR